MKRILLFVLILLLAVLAWPRGRTPVETAKFYKGQVVAVTVPAATVQYFKIGYIDRELEDDGQIHHYYTDADGKIGGEWPEESLRALTKKECGQ